MAHHLRFIYIFPLIETNKRVRLARTLASGYLDGVGGRETALTDKEMFLMDAYFPFDPYVLPRSKRWLVNDYVEWKPVPGMPVERDDDDDDDDDDIDVDDDDDEDSDSSDGESAGSGELDDASTEVSL